MSADNRKSIKLPTKDTAAPIARRAIVNVEDSHAAGAAAISGVATENHPETDPEQQDKVTAMVPKSFKLRKVDHSEIQIMSGVQELPMWVVEHWWSKANGVTIYTGRKAEE